MSRTVKVIETESRRVGAGLEEGECPMETNDLGIVYLPLICTHKFPSQPFKSSLPICFVTESFTLKGYQKSPGDLVNTKISGPYTEIFDSVDRFVFLAAAWEHI